MGSTSSKHPEYEAALAVFSTKEQHQINNSFSTISERADEINVDQLLTHLEHQLPLVLAKRLFDAMRVVVWSEQVRGATFCSGVNLQHYTVMLSYMLKGTASQRCHVLLSLAAPSGDTDGNHVRTPTASGMIQVITHLLGSFMSMMTRTSQWRSWHVSYLTENHTRMAQFLLKDIVDPDKSDATLNFDELEKWLLKSSFVSRMLDFIFYSCFPISNDVELKQLIPMVPLCVGVDWTSCQTLLDLSSLVFLNHSLPVQCSGEWRLLFSSRTHGQSFSTMMKCATNRGPTVLIVKDNDHCVFGGFADQSWTINSNFYGSASCFLFTLAPSMGLYNPSGVNENYLYLNQGQQTLPNGLGFGGQFDYFGLWIDSEFGKGHSKAEPTCLTYASPQLSRADNFTFHHLEIWGVGDASLQQESTKPSILDQDPGARALLSLAGRAPVSDGLRDEDSLADVPAETSLPPL